MSVGAVQKRYPISNRGESSSDGASTQKIDDIDTKGIDIIMSLTVDRYSPTYYAELYWRYYFKRGTSTESLGEDPKDSIGFSWMDACWEVDSYDLEATSHSSSHVTFEDSAFGADSFGFSVDDSEIGAETTCSGTDYKCETYSDYYFGGIYLTSEEGSNAECDTNTDTKILGVYDHTWDGSYSKFGISGGYGSIGITYTTESYVDHEQTTTEDDGSTALLVTRDDAESGSF